MLYKFVKRKKRKKKKDFFLFSKKKMIGGRGGGGGLAQPRCNSIKSFWCCMLLKNFWLLK